MGAAVLGGVAAGLLVPEATASGGAPAPTFDHPRTIDHPYWPFEAGRVLIEKDPTAEAGSRGLQLHLDRGQTIQWRGQPVECSVLRSERIEDGELVAWSEQFVAQADDGTLFTFGEIGEDDEDDSDGVDDEDDGWVVGGELPGTNLVVHSVDEPLVLLPAELEVGRSWRVEIPPLGTETARVIRTEQTVITPAGVYSDCVQVLETPHGGSELELSWYAPGIGPVQKLDREEHSRLAEVARQIGKVEARLRLSTDRRAGRFELSLGSSEALLQARLFGPTGDDLSTWLHSAGGGIGKGGAPLGHSREVGTVALRSPELPLEQLLAAFPEGRYQLRAHGPMRSSPLHGELDLRHRQGAERP